MIDLLEAIRADVAEFCEPIARYPWTALFVVMAVGAVWALAWWLFLVRKVSRPTACGVVCALSIASGVIFGWLLLGLYSGATGICSWGPSWSSSAFLRLTPKVLVGAPGLGILVGVLVARKRRSADGMETP